MEESKQRSKIKADGKMGALRGDGQKLKKPKKMKNKKLKAPPTKDLAVTTKQLSSMIKTGLPLLDSLNIISDTAENVTIKYVFKETSLGISKGLSMSENLEKYPEVFNEMYLALVSAGETAGLLPDTLEREAKLLESLAKINDERVDPCLNILSLWEHFVSDILKAGTIQKAHQKDVIDVRVNGLKNMRMIYPYFDSYLLKYLNHLLSIYKNFPLERLLYHLKL